MTCLACLRFRVRLIGLVGALMLSPAAGSAQAEAVQAAPVTPSTGLLRVFVDCGSCDAAHLRQNVAFIDYVRDRADADLHVLVTTQGTGGGGTSWVVRFIGLGRFDGEAPTLSFETEATSTADDRRRAFARIFRLGLARFAASTPAAPTLDVTYQPPDGLQTTASSDPWNYWVFTVDTSGNVNGERSRTSRSYNVRVSSDRTTDTLKVGLNASRNTRTTTFEIDEDGTITNRTQSWNLNGRIVKSLGSRWSMGATGSMSHSSFSNIDLSSSLAPAIEFNVFPYSQSAERSLTLHYAVGATRYRYTDVTVFDKTEETIPRHAFAAAVNLRQPWGTLYANGNLSQHLNHRDRYRAGVYGSANVRLFRGFSFNVYAEYQKINDQISLRKADASEQEVLLQLRQLATSYSYSLNFGISYRFGSLFNNVVNTRFNESAF